MSPKPSSSGSVPAAPPVAQSTPLPAQGNPLIPSGVQDHNFHTQAVFEINSKVAKLETGLENIEERLEKVETKLSKIEDDVAAINTKIDFVKPFAQSIGKGIWAIVLILITFGFTMLGYWTKHHFGW